MQFIESFELCYVQRFFFIFQVEEALVEKRKRELLEQYMTPEFLESVSATSELLGVNQTANQEGDVEVEVEEEEEEVEEGKAVQDTEMQEDPQAQQTEGV